MQYGLGPLETDGMKYCSTNLGHITKMVANMTNIF